MNHSTHSALHTTIHQHTDTHGNSPSTTIAAVRIACGEDNPKADENNGPNQKPLQINRSQNKFQTQSGRTIVVMSVVCVCVCATCTARRSKSAYWNGKMVIKFPKNQQIVQLGYLNRKQLFYFVHLYDNIFIK